ncbi:breast cancer type 1 susceptibility protein isoform X2 [Apteryx mantelli]|uniref:RING-type E3 ubiquitin transferase n=1 Tax=Apteryx mantelli TaxID=2696672 RepID=A0A8B7J780_9AVES
MDLSVIAVGDVQNVLSAMQKNLECPICLDVIKEPVSTKCDHIFCRFCMFKLLSKKKKGVIQCPLCKTEVTKRSLQENSRFKQLIEGLLETIHAFELDTGVKFLNSHHFSKTSIEANAAEALCKESSIIQSRGFRNRKKRAKENGQENCTLEANTDPQLTDTRVKRCPLRNRNQKCDSDTGIYIEFGSDSSEELFKQAGNTGRLGDKEVLQLSSQEKLEELKSSEKGNEYSCKIQPVKLRAKEVILPNVIGESDSLKEGLSKKSTQNITEHAKPGQVNVTECQSSPLNVLSADLLAEQCERVGNASPLRKGGTSFFKNMEEMDAEQTQCNSKSKESDLEDSSESKVDKSKEIDIVVQCVEDVEMCEPENDSLPEEEPPLEKPETLHSDTLNQVSRKRLKRSIQKVNEWFSKSNEILSSGSSQDGPAEATDTSAEGDAYLSDKDSCISEKTNLMVNCMEITVIEENKKLSKPAADSIKDKIFGKTYKRERKSNPPIILREILPTAKNEDVAADEKCLNNSTMDKLKRKRKTACVLQPEYFIKKKDLGEADGCPQSVNWCLGETEKKKHDENSAVNESSVTEKRKDNTLAELGEGESIWKNATEEVTGESNGALEPNNCDQKSTKKTRSSLAKKCRHSTRAMHALQLVVGRNSGSPDPAEPQIDSYPSSEEPRKVDSEHRQVRRSRRLQLLAEEMTKETGKRRILTEGAGKYDSRSGGSFSGVQRNVLVHSSECKDLGEQQDILSYRPATNLKSAELEADEIQISLKNSSDTANTGKSPFNPTSSCQHSNFGSVVPDTDSQEGEILGSPFLLGPPSVNAVQTASQVTKEKATEACTTFPQDNGHYTDNVPEDFRNEKSLMTENVLELTKEAEDSELDTQYLRNIFRHSKRLSFTLYPSPMKACVIEDAASETLKISCADQVENKHSKYLKTENLQVEKTASESLNRVCEKEKLKTYESVCVSPVSCFVSNTERMHTGEHRENVSQVADQGNLTSPIRIGGTVVENKNEQQKREQANNKTVSADTVIESELSQNPFESNKGQSDQSNTEEHVFQRINTVNEIGFSSESNQAENAEVDEGKGPLLHFQPSMVCSTVCQQSPAEFNCKDMEKKDGIRERKQAKSNEEQATQTASIGMPECLISEALEHPLKVSTDFPGLSETPDGLLCSDDDIEENSSFCETDRKERSAVFVKRSDSALVKELDGRSVNSTPISQGIQRSRRRVQKLQSSEEESSEDENLPCFQALIFGKSASTPLQFNKQMTSVVGSSVNPSTLPHSGSHNDRSMQKTPGAALSTGCVSPSQESECSVNLFSSQSNLSEESVDGAQELKKPLTLVLASKQMSNQNDNKETFQSCNGGLKKRKTNLKDEYQEDPNMGANLGEASGYDSETSHVEDSSGPFSQAEILTTQQKNAMQNNLKKLQQEMAVLEAVLKQHESQDSEFSPVCKQLPHSSSEGALRTEQMRQVRGTESTSKVNFAIHKCSSSKGFSPDDFHVKSSDSSNIKIKELEEGSPVLLLPSPKSCLLKRPDLEKGLQCDSVLKNKAPFQEKKTLPEAVKERSQCQLESENAADEKSGAKRNSASVLPDLCGNVSRSPNSSSSSIRLLHPQTAEATNSSAVAQNANRSCNQGCKQGRSVCFPTSVLHNTAGKENATSPVVTNRREMSIVASGLNRSEHLVVQKFARKTQSTLSNHITEGTTHVIMKTDMDLVCERTLKYFLGIAGRKWVVSYQWVIQSFKEGRILDEDNFEVRGDVINGRNHQGPKRARQSLTERIFKDFEICCYGPFTDMTTEHLEWMVELCGASVVKQLHLFKHKTNSTAVVVVQPAAWMENTGYRAIQQKNNVAVVTREWVLDSVACYECQEFDAYLVS